MTDSIVIEDLVVKTVIGCLSWERQIKQPLHIDLTVYTDLTQACESDSLEHTLNYAEICQLTQHTIQQAQPKLIEHAGFLVLKGLFERFPSIEKIKIHLRKPAIIPDTQSVGISLEWERHAFCSRFIQ